MQRSVLVVDDEADIRDLVSMWLRGDPRCRTVTEADDADTALAAAQQHQPDAVLLDLFLGRRLSVEVLPRMRDALPDATIIIYTGSQRAAVDARALDAGADVIAEKLTVPVEDVIDLLLT